LEILKNDKDLKNELFLFANIIMSSRSSDWMWIKFILAVLTAVVVIAVAGVAIASIVVPSNVLSQQCYVIRSPFGDLLGYILLDSSELQISWELQYVGYPQANNLYILGPIPPGTTSTTNIQLALCGSPSTLACDNTVPNVLNQQITTIGGYSLKPYIQAIRDNPALFSLQLNNGTAFPLGFSCGH
jgi:hypothetical protein